jgi:cytochrome b6-f complex iron-sulfur subunit
MSEAKATPAETIADDKAEATVGALEGTGVTRRELLNYAWLASLGIFLAQIGGVGYLFAMPRFKVGEFGGVFILSTAEIPSEDAPPKPVNEGRFWLVNTGSGVLALYKVCTHLGCLYDWAESEGKFICPCHGSQFAKDGTYLAGPAPRSLDRFPITAVDAAGNPVATKELTGTPDDALEVPEGAISIKIDTGKRKFGKGRG